MNSSDQIAAANFAEIEREEMIELLAQIREWLDDQQDAEYDTDRASPRPNKAMQFCTAIDELIGEYT